MNSSEFVFFTLPMRLLAPKHLPRTALRPRGPHSTRSPLPQFTCEMCSHSWVCDHLFLVFETEGRHARSPQHVCQVRATCFL